MKVFPLAVRRAIVIALATGSTPSEAARVVLEQHGVTVSRQVCARHDPRTVSGSALNDELKALFFTVHEKFLDGLEQIGIAHRAVRLVRLEHAYERAETAGDTRTMLRVLDAARREMVDLYPEPDTDDDLEGGEHA
jgi:hypothetical protein